MKKLAIIFFSVVALVWLLGSLSNPGQSRTAAPSAVEQAKASEFAKAVSAGTKASSKWSEIKVDEASDRDYKLTLWYRDMPTGQAEVERDAKAVAQAALTELMRQGRKPAQEHIFLTVRAHKPEKGATGESLTRVFGRAVYDYNNDTIEYKVER
jgi:hypothetical protein